jgi:hypothetical protein
VDVLLASYENNSMIESANKKIEVAKNSKNNYDSSSLRLQEI